MTALEEAMALIVEEPKQIKPKKFKATAYLERCLRGAMDGIDTDDEALLDEFVWSNCQSGYTCEILYAETGERKVFYAEKFTTETTSIEELLAERGETI
jgi:hypothetical protein